MLQMRVSIRTCTGAHIARKLRSGLKLNILYEEDNRTLLGQIYEVHVFDNYLQTGKTIEAKSLTCKRSTKSFVINDRQTFTNVQTFQDPKRTLYKPVEKNKCGVDAVYIFSITTGWLLLITVNNKHKRLNVLRVCNQFQGITERYICCIHPPVPEEKKFNFPTVYPNIELKYTCVVDYLIIS